MCILSEKSRLAEQTLSEQPDRPTLLFIHHPPFNIEPHYLGGYRQQREAEDLTMVANRHLQVKRLICGHVHCLHRETWAGTVATTMPSVAVDLRKSMDQEIGDAPLYVLHKFSEDGNFVTQPKLATD